MELNIESSEYPKYIRLIEQYISGMLKDDDIILLSRNDNGTIAGWFFNHDFMQKLDFEDPDMPIDDQEWILLYRIELESNRLIEATVLDVALELEYRLMGSPKIKALREELGLSLEDLAINLRIPKMTLYRIENGLEIPPSYFMRSIYVQLIDEVEQKRFEEENPRNDFLDKLLNGTLNEDNKKDEKYNEALEAVAAEMLDDSIDNLGKNKKNNFEDEEEIYITPSKLAIDNFYKKAFADLEEKTKKKLEDND